MDDITSPASLVPSRLPGMRHWLLRFLFGVLGKDFKKKILSSPSFFDANWYLERNFDVKQAGLDPLQHYLDYGFAEGRPPNGWAGGPIGADRSETQTFDDARFFRAASYIEASGLFDADWYSKQYSVPRGQALGHFLGVGILESTDPNPFFSSERYYFENPDVKDTGENALNHYLVHGFLEGRKGCFHSRYSGRTTLRETIWVRGLY